MYRRHHLHQRHYRHYYHYILIFILSRIWKLGVHITIHK